MDNIEPLATNEELSLGAEVVKSLTVSAAAAAGTILGFIAISSLIDGFSKVRTARKNKKLAKAETK